jgi:nucleoside-diphosphate-sugar epimerase
MNKKINIEWDLKKPVGEKYRVTSIEKAKDQLGWLPRIGFDEGILKTMEWYQKNKTKLLKKYTILSEE